MPDTNISFFWAFAAGFLSFLGPCVLPLIPGYLSFISGYTVEELNEATTKKREHVLWVSILFVLGFSLIFTLMGASASLIGSFLLTYRSLLNKIAAVLIIIFGISLLGLFKIPFFQGISFTHKIKNRGPFSVFLLGMAFAVAWMPCIGPILTSILTFAGSTGTVGTGMALLAVYSLGLGIPFILSGLLFSRFITAFGWIRKHYTAITVISGLLLIAMGVLILTGQIVYVNSWLRGLQTSPFWSWTNL